MGEGRDERDGRGVRRRAAAAYLGIDRTLALFEECADMAHVA